MKPLAVLVVKPHLAPMMFLAAGSISQALGQAGGIINAFALIGAFAGLVFAGWAAKMGRTEMIKYWAFGERVVRPGLGHRERDVSGRRAERIHPAAGAELKGKEVRRAKHTAGEVSTPSISRKRENLARLCLEKMNMAFGGNMNVVAGLIGGGVGVAISGLAIWLKRPQYMKYGLLMAVDAGLAYTIWRCCAG